MADADSGRRGPQAACRAVERALDRGGARLGVARPAPTGTYVVTLPGTRKLSTTCSLVVGRHTLSVNAFVVRRPDENHEAFYRWLLERNPRMYGVELRDRPARRRLPRRPAAAGGGHRRTSSTGCSASVLENADGSFNTLLELGFASAIRKEYAWRTSRGESTRNLDAFAHLTRDA